MFLQKCDYLRGTLTLALLALMSGCGGSDESSAPEGVDASSPPEQCSVEQQKQFVWELLSDSYLWADEMPASIDLANYHSAEDLLQQLRYQPDDRFSFIMSLADYQDFFEVGQTIGLGYSAALNDSDSGYQVRFVYQDSPAYLAGLRRGDLIQQINDRPVTEIAMALANNTLSWEAIIGAKSVGVVTRLQWTTPSGEHREASMTKDRFSTNTVHGTQLLDTEIGQVGYLALTSFTEPGKSELTRVFSQFQQAGIEELILDLRYNGGGRSSTANQLSSDVAGVHTLEQIFTHYLHNDTYRHLDSTVDFQGSANGLNLSRLIVLTSNESCSASEMTINSLRPFIEVVTVGGTSCGKPIGMYPHQFCDQVILPIEFKVANALRQGDYFDGISADCIAQAHPEHRWGDVGDGLLGEAVYFLENGQCSSGPLARKSSRADRVRHDDLNPLRHHF